MEAPSTKPDDPPPARSLAMRVVEKYLGADAEFKNGKLVLAGNTIPIASDRSHRDQLRRPARNVSRATRWRILKRPTRRATRPSCGNWVNGKVVLLGIDFADEDRCATPFFTPFSGPKWTTAGVEIHANTIRTILDRKYLVPVADVGACARAAACDDADGLDRSRGLAGIARGAVHGARSAGGDSSRTHLLFEGGLILSTSEILLATSICLIGSVIYRFSTEEKGRNLFHRAVSLFVGKQLASSLEETEAIGLIRQAPGRDHPVHRYPRIHGVQRRSLREAGTRGGGAAC